MSDPCATCPFKGRTRVGFDGPVDAKFAVIGEAPAMTEVRQGKPFCLVPDTLVLMADLTWRPLGDVHVGDQILAIDENAERIPVDPERQKSASGFRSGRKLQVATVLATHTRKAKAVQTFFDHGDLAGTPDHRVLSYCSSKGRKSWQPLSMLNTGPKRFSCVASIGIPWKPVRTYEAGWLAGFLEGEGHVLGSRKGRLRRAGELGFSQNSGPVHQHAKRLIETMGFPFRAKEESRAKGVVCVREHLAGGLPDVIRFLGMIRPQRLMDDFMRVVPGRKILQLRRHQILSREPLGERDVIDLTTTTGTYIANGFIVHNCGPAGQLLDQFLGFFKIPRENIRVGNVILCGPIDSDKERLMGEPGPNGYGTMFEHALSCCAERREAEGDLQSKVVLSLGVSATWGLMGHRIPLGGKRPQRGALFRDWKGRAIFPTWHPAMLLRAGGQGDSRPGKTSDAEAQAVANDLAKAWRFANGEQEEFKFYRCDPKDTVEFCANARKAKKLIAVDVESDSLDALTTNLTIVGIAVEDADGILALSLWWPSTTPEQQEAVRALLADKAVPKILQNGNFDQTVLERHDLPIHGTLRDTLLEHHAIAPECDHDLSSIVCNYIITPPWKAEYYAREAVRKRRGIKDIEDELQYNAGDAATTLAVAPYLDEECRQADVRHVADFDVRLAEVARQMRIWGVPVDTKVRDEIGQALKQRSKDAQTRIQNMLIEAIQEGEHPVYIERFLKTVAKTKRLSLSSPYQLEAMMDLLEVPVPPGALTKGKKMRSTKNEIIATIGHPFTRTLVEYRSAEKLVSTFVDGIGLKMGEDNRIHPDWQIHAAVTGRWASRPMFLNWRKDLKDPSRNMRRMIVAPPGRKFVGMDKSQLEFRLIALVAGQEDLLEALSDTTRDVHAENTARFYPDVWPVLTDNMNTSKKRMAELEALMVTATSPLQRRQFETLRGEAEHQYKESSTARKRLRELTKRATYASLYGSTAENLFIKLRSDEKLRDMGMEIEPVQCVRFVQMFPQLWPKIETWRRQVMVDAAAAQQSVSPLLGRKRPFPLGRLDPTQAVNFPIQSAGADLVGMELLDLWENLDCTRDWIILQIHDAVVIETDEDRAQDVMELVLRSMTSEVELNGYKCLFPAEARIGQSWDQV